jgi:hypothetical protein
MPATARELPTLPPSADLAAAWAKWDDWQHPTTDAEVAAMVALLMTAPLRTRLDSPDGPLIIDTAGWTREAGEAAKAAAEAAGPEYSPEWSAAYASALDATPHTRVTLTSDGGPACVGPSTARWCQCPDIDGTEWVRYEFWTTESGQADRRHGWVCPRPDCRKITQTG